MVNLIASNIVILAQNLNPSIFSQLWLIKAGVITEKENIENAFFTPSGVSFDTPHFELIVVPERLQVSFKKTDIESQIALMERTCGRIVKELPHTPYTAVGFNMDWAIEIADETNYKKTMGEIFLSNSNAFAAFFASDSPIFGMTLAKEIIGMRLTLTLSQAVNQKTKAKGMLFKFNFNQPIEEKDRTTDILIAILNKWLEARKIADTMIMEGITKWNFLKV